MTLYEERMKEVKDNNKVVFYDYLLYKRESGWFTGIFNDDWHRPEKIQNANYNGSFLKNLPEYYFLGFPIKELLKSCYSNGMCHACCVALSLYFDSFEIITCNLNNYTKHYNEKTDTKKGDFEHSILLTKIDGKEIIIDTTWGMITDYETYKYIFDIDKVRKISSKELKNTEVYKYIENRKYNNGPSRESELQEDLEYQKYINELDEYMNMCKNYSNTNNYVLQDFINRCLLKTSNSFYLWDRRSSFQTKVMIDYQIEYPDYDMNSIKCDEFDFVLDSPYENTKKRNEEVLNNYHKVIVNEEKSNKGFKNKVLRLLNRFI